MDLFRPERILKVFGIPEYFVHGVRHMELLPGDMIRMVICRDEPVIVTGLPPHSVPVLALNIPTPCALWNSQAIYQWSFDRGLTCKTPLGPSELRPKVKLMC
jgi:hypothetical protein